MAWAEQGGFEDIPVVTVKRNYEPWPFFERDWGIPTIAHVGPDMTVLSVDEGVGTPNRWL